MIRDRNVLLSWINSLSPADHEFMIILPHPDDTDSEIIGECSLDENGEIGLMILPKYWRKGYGTDTVKQLMQLAEDLGLKVERRQIPEEELATFEEAGACGTAAVISPIERIDDLDTKQSFVISKNGEPGPICRKLYEKLQLLMLLLIHLK